MKKCPPGYKKTPTGKVIKIPALRKGPGRPPKKSK